MFKSALLGIFDKLGYRLQKKNDLSDADIRDDAAFMKLYEQSSAYTMTSQQRMYALYQAIQYIHANEIEGSVVECGVWKGGSSMMAASALLAMGGVHRDIFLYDTFEGMSEPDENDVSVRGEKMTDNWDTVGKDEKLFCYSSLDEVQDNFAKVGYPLNKTHFVKGKVEDTIPGVIPEKIALLRLDTDWYASTWHELVHLFPRLTPKGVLIIDDYGHWEGARKAVDEYFSQNGIQPLLSRIDYTGRMMIKLP